MWILNIATVVATILLGVYWYLKKIRLTYWKRKGLQYIEPEFHYGNFRGVMKMEEPFVHSFHRLYKEFKSRGLKHAGVYMSFTPMYMPIDIGLIKCILQKDFSHFVNHGTYYNAEDDPLTAHLFNLEDAKWRNLRAKLTPTFTSGKMKMMFQTLVDCSDGLEKKLSEYSTIQDSLDIKDLMARFSTDVIGSCAFGLDCESLRNPDSEFRNYGRKIFELSTEATIRRLISLLFPHNFLRKIGFRFIKRDIERFFLKVVKDTVEYREKNNVFRKDFMHLMLQLRNKGSVTDDESIFGNESNSSNQSFLTMNELSAQCFVFFAAGFETSSTTMTFALYELSRCQDVQDKLREEIRSTFKRHGDKLTYESIMEMSYLDRVINETLRLHPPVSGTLRKCNKDYPVPGTDFVLDAGVGVHIPIYEVHRDPEYYPDPDVFNPERFTEKEKAKRPPCTFLPFGEGPRICIGLRFGVMQAKVGLVRTIKDYRVTLNKKTRDPLKYDPRSGILSAEGDVWVNVTNLV